MMIILIYLKKKKKKRVNDQCDQCHLRDHREGVFVPNSVWSLMNHQ